MEIAYIAHPVGGDVAGNIEKILKIVREININEPDVVPFVPYLADLYALNDDIPEERNRGIKNGLSLIEAGFITECRLYGDRISAGMSAEIKQFICTEIPVKPMTDETMFSFTNNNY